MRENDRNEESKINPVDDRGNRTLFGAPTIGGIVVIVIFILYAIFN